MKQYFIYILTNTYNTVFYTGITNNLKKRVWQHKQKLVSGFTEKYNLWKLVYYEVCEDVKSAIAREKQIKDYRREKKIALIKSLNPSFDEIHVD